MMSLVKRDLERYEELKDRLQSIAVDEGALSYNDETDEIVSNADDEAERDTYERVTKMAQAGEFGDHSLEEVHDALKDVLGDGD